MHSRALTTRQATARRRISALARNAREGALPEANGHEPADDHPERLPASAREDRADEAN
ncbi:hypothetical protein GCM10023175_53320 [Pseudonocardia xishanensis]|uniref:Uncharacterized protein n=1 Tax=Pseudonocardia xishanensis TaxID=630995 RepID=A0ABP8S0M5_9PSEU